MRFVWYPLIVGGTVGAWFLASPHVAREQLGLLNLAISAILIPLLLLSEKLMPHEREWTRSRGDVVADLLASLVVLPAVVAAAEAIDRLALPSLQVFDAQSRGAGHVLIEVGVVLFFAEFAHYWLHRAAHHWMPLWRLHAVHHGAPRVYWGNAGRFHPLDLVVIFPFYLAPVVVLGMSPEAFSLFMAINAATGFLEHANVDFASGPLKYVFNTAELHRLHHANDLATSRNNYGKVLCIWDVVFRTHRHGPSTTDVGAGHEVPVTFFAQLAHPFRKWP